MITRKLPFFNFYSRISGVILNSHNQLCWTDVESFQIIWHKLSQIGYYFVTPASNSKGFNKKKWEVWAGAGLSITNLQGMEDSAFWKFWRQGGLKYGSHLYGMNIFQNYSPFIVYVRLCKHRKRFLLLKHYSGCDINGNETTWSSFETTSICITYESTIKLSLNLCKNTRYLTSH